MFISEIPVRCASSTGQTDKSIRWIGDLTSRTTARDVILSTLPACDPAKYTLNLRLGRHKQTLKDTARIYRVVASIDQQQYAHRLLFELRSKPVKKRVRFADEIIVQTIVKGQRLSDEKLRADVIETISMPMKQQAKDKRPAHVRFSSSSSTKR